jgi:diacylglycerol kinase (ATP)
LRADRQRHGPRRTLDALRFSWAGLKMAWRREAAFREEALLAVLLLPAAFILGEGPIEQILLAGSWLLVLIVELLNTAVETAIDRIGSEQNRLSGLAKDLGSAAVLLALLLAALVWGRLLLPRWLG